MVYRIAFSAGELSGDEHLSEVLKALQVKFPDASFRGLAGPKTRALGIDTELALEDYASVMGFGQVVGAVPKILSALAWFKKTFATWKPDLLVLVDYPDFNLKVAKHAKAAGAKVLYYIPPKIWIWRSGRINQIESLVDKVALIFPFEKDFYEKLGYEKSVYVGHPFHNSIKVDAIKNSLERKQFFECHALDTNKPTLAFFPGSRKSEIKRHWPGMVAGLKQLIVRVPNLQILLSVAPSVRNLVADYLKKDPIQCVSIEGKNLEILRFSDVGFLKSGTTNLQAAFYKLPFIMYYHASLLSEMIVRVMIKIRQFSLVNIIRPGTIIELLQGRAGPEKIAEQLETLIKDQTNRSEVINGLKEVTDQLGSYENLPIFESCKTPAERAAMLGVELLKN